MIYIHAVGISVNSTYNRKMKMGTSVQTPYITLKHTTQQIHFFTPALTKNARAVK